MTSPLSIVSSTFMLFFRTLSPLCHLAPAFPLILDTVTNGEVYNIIIRGGGMREAWMALMYGGQTYGSMMWKLPTRMNALLLRYWTCQMSTG